MVHLFISEKLKKCAFQCNFVSRYLPYILRNFTMKYISVLLVAIVHLSFAMPAAAQNFWANNDTAYLYTAYQPLLITPLLNDDLAPLPDYYYGALQIIGEPLQGIMLSFCDYYDNPSDCNILYMPYESFGVYDSMQYRLTIYDDMGSLVDSSNIATIYVIRNELPSDDCLSDCVYPGDTNRDGIVNSDDLLYIGATFGTSGVARIAEEQSIDWQPHAADAWTDSLNGINYKHFDCNGDGTINELDMDAIYLNYGLDHYLDVFSTSLAPPDTSITANVAISILNTSPVQLGDTIIADISLSEPMEIYGVSLSVLHNADDNSTGTIEFLPSFITDDNNVVSLSRNQGNGKMSASVVRTNQLAMQGSGAIARVSFVMENFLEGKQLSDLLTISIDKLAIMTNNATWLNLAIGSPSFTAAIDVINDISTPQPLPDISLSPTPAHSYLYIANTHNKHIESIKLYDTKGVLHYQQIAHSDIVIDPTIPVATLPKGFYVALIKTTQNTIVQKIVIQH